MPRFAKGNFGLDGLGLVRALHDDPDLNGIPVLMLTSVDLPRFAAIRDELGVEHYLTKPVFLDDLREVTRQILGRRAIGAPHPRQRSSENRLRVLVAEDNGVNRRLMEQLLGRLGHDVQLVSNGREAIEAARTMRFDVILMDCQMPEVDGFMATRHLREAGDTTPIVALTAYALEGDRDKCIAAGMDNYLTKPIDFPELERTLGAYVHPGVNVRMPAEVPDHV
ncbi:MAG: response regulator [Acidobacteria bacterium]|nr:response regulator [Acidobacteriota bacterium]